MARSFEKRPSRRSSAFSMGRSPRWGTPRRRGAAVRDESAWSRQVRGDSTGVTLAPQGATRVESDVGRALERRAGCATRQPTVACRDFAVRRPPSRNHSVRNRLTKVLTSAFVVFVTVIFGLFFGQRSGQGSGDVAEVDGKRI